MSIFKNMGLVVLLIAFVFSSGCASYLSAKASQREIATQRIIASQNKDAMDALKMGVQPEVAIKAVQLNNGGVGIGVNLLALDTLTENPIRQVGAALLDAALLYGTYSLVDNITQSGNDNTSSTRSISTPININNASRTTITIDNSEHTSTSTSTTSTQSDNHAGDGNNR